MAELSGLEVLALTEEIDNGLRGSYVNNIYTIGDAQIIRLRRPGGEDVNLVASPRLGAWLSEQVSEREQTKLFTTTLRKLLMRTKFEGASQGDLDRIFVLELRGDGPIRLILELMPPGNIIVTDGVGRILAIKEEVRSPRRRLVRGGNYEPPRQTRLSPDQVGGNDVTAMAEKEETAGQAIGKHVSLPRKYVREALARLSLVEGSPSSALLGREVEVVGVLNELVGEAKNSPSPCLASSGQGLEIFAVRPRGSEVKKTATTLSSLCDEVLLGEVLQGGASGTAGADRGKAELEGRISKLQKEADALRSQATKGRELAEEALKAGTAGEALKAIEELGIKVRRQAGSAAAVASLAYDRAKELEEKATEVKRAAERLRRSGTRTVGKPLPARRSLPTRRGEWYEKFRWFRTSGGKLAVGGRDASSNSILIKRHMEDGDTVFHADLFGSPFFVLKGGKEQTEDEVRELAQATAAFSSAWKTGLGSADAYWVRPDQVKTAAPSGEYLPRGSFAIEGKKNHVSKNIVEIAVGLTGTGELTAGPESSFKERSPAYLVVRPQREKSSDTAKRVLRDLGSMVGGQLEYTVDDILRVLPSGGGKVVRKARPSGYMK